MWRQVDRTRDRLTLMHIWMLKIEKPVMEAVGEWDISCINTCFLSVQITELQIYSRDRRKMICNKSTIKKDQKFLKIKNTDDCDVFRIKIPTEIVLFWSIQSSYFRLKRPELLLVWLKLDKVTKIITTVSTNRLWPAQSLFQFTL